MDAFTAKGALLTGVDLIRRRPLLVLLWAAVQLALTMVFALSLQVFRAWVTASFAGGVGIGNLDLVGVALGLVRAVLSMLLGAMLWTSAFRAILRPGSSASLRLGAEELVVLLAQVFTQAVAALPVMALQPTVFIAMGVEGILAVNRWSLTVFEILGLFWSAVASVWAFEQVRIAPFRCWTIARGRFWLLAGLVVGVIVLRLLANVGVNWLEADLGHLFRPRINPALYRYIAAGPRVLDVFRIPALVGDVLFAALRALEIAVLAGIVSSVYRTRPQAPQAATFSSAVRGPAS